jgi:hypothetical protein
MDAKSHVCSPDFLFFLVSTFDICCETSFVFPKLNRHFIFDLPLNCRPVSSSFFFLWLSHSLSHSFFFFNMPPV